MNADLFYSMYNAVHNPPNYGRYIGKKYQYGQTIITIVGIYNDNYFETTSNDSSLKVCYHIPSFLKDVKDGVYKEAHV